MKIPEGRQQCTANAKTTGKRCERIAIPHHHVCRYHGGNAPQVRAKAVQNFARATAVAMVRREGYALDVDPLDALQELLGESVSLKDRLGRVVGRLEDDSLRYDGRAGEQLRGELQAYMAIMRDVAKFSETIVKLGISERRQRLAEAQAMMVVAAVKAILTRLELTGEQQMIAARVVPEELRAIAAAPVPEAIPA